MEWRVFVELSGLGGAAKVHQVHAGGAPASECSAATLGLTLTEAKAVLAGLQRHLVRIRPVSTAVMVRRLGGSPFAEAASSRAAARPAG